MSPLIPPNGTGCNNNLGNYVNQFGRYILNNSDGSCSYCTISTTNAWLESVNAIYSERWRNFGIIVAFIAINIIGTIILCWTFRVPKGFNLRKNK